MLLIMWDATVPISGTVGECDVITDAEFGDTMTL